MTKEVESKVQEIIMEGLMLDETPSMTDHLINDLGADSLDSVELIMTVEKEFDIAIPDEEAEKILTVENIVAIVKEKIG